MMPYKVFCPICKQETPHSEETATFRCLVCMNATPFSAAYVSDVHTAIARYSAQELADFWSRRPEPIHLSAGTEAPTITFVAGEVDKPAMKVYHQGPQPVMFDELAHWKERALRAERKLTEAKAMDAKEYLMKELNMSKLQAETLYDGYISACERYAALKSEAWRDIAESNAAANSQACEALYAEREIKEDWKKAAAECKEVLDEVKADMKELLKAIEFPMEGMHNAEAWDKLIRRLEEKYNYL